MNSDGHTIYTQLDMKVMVDGEKGDGMHGMHLGEYNDGFRWDVAASCSCSDIGKGDATCITLSPEIHPS